MADEVCRFLEIPLELRELIYKEVFSDPSEGPQLLQTCREIYAQAYKFLFQRPLILRSQSALFKWLDKVPQDFLRQIGDITLEVRDVDLTPLLPSISSPSIRQTNLAPPVHTWDVYESELGQLRRALGSLPNVKAFTLRALTGWQSHLYDDFVAKVLVMVGSVYTGLQELSLEGNLHRQRLTFLRSFRNVKSLTFDGFSASGPAETAEILCNLQLTNISLVSQQAMLTPPDHRLSMFTSKGQSFDENVVKWIDHLASFSVTEQIPRASDALFFTSKILDCLHNHKTLKSLSISLGHVPDAETLDALRRFLNKSSSIERLKLDWPDLDAEILGKEGLLPATLKDLWIRTDTMASAFNILRHISQSRESENIPDITQAVLIRSPRNWNRRNDSAGGYDGLAAWHAGVSEDKDTDTNRNHNDSTEDASYDDRVATAKRCLDRAGVKVAWCTERV